MDTSGISKPVAAEVAAERRHCKLCHRMLPATAAGRVTGKTWQCRTCLSLHSMLYRNLGPGVLEEWNEEQKRSFFQKGVASCPAQDNTSWETVRTCVVQVQTKARLEESGSQVVSEALPMGVWLQRGFEKEAVRSKVEKELLQREKDLRKKDKGKKRKQADGEEEQANADEEEWDVAPAQKPMAFPGAAKAKARKPAREEKEADRQKRLDKENKKTDKDNKMNDSVKALAALTPLAKSLGAIKAQAQKISLPLATLEAALIETEEKKTQANALVTSGNHVAAHAPLPPLPFSMEDLKNHVKATKSLLAQTRKDVRAAKDAKAAAEEGS
ncbi:Uncharacterized protein SCF082_LOCUS28874 [Durusdinium trenchii]|uniref:Uncharacterized protein n=1 Tax=Durusdinium trenchii TaxID=1381693 RepID=A0ABP0MMZ8_9DINO